MKKLILSLIAAILILSFGISFADQSVNGGRSASENLVLRSTTNATKGFIKVDSALIPLGIGTIDLGSETYYFNNVYSTNFVSTAADGYRYLFPGTNTSLTPDVGDYGIFWEGTGSGSTKVSENGVEKSVATLGTSGNMPTGMTFAIDGAGAEITTGLKTCAVAKEKMTLTGWTLIADQNGAIKIDVWKDTYANYQPTNTDSMCNGHEPEIAASSNKAQDTDISDWTTVTVLAGDIVCVNVDSVSTITWAHLALTGFRAP